MNRFPAIPLLLLGGGLLALRLAAAPDHPAGWQVDERPGSLRVANASLAVEITRVAGGSARILLQVARPDGEWQPLCRTVHPDFAISPEANRLFDTRATAHRYLASEILSEFSVSAEADRPVQIRMTGRIQDRIVAEQTLTLDPEGRGLHVDVSATLHEPLLDYFLSAWEFLPPGEPDFVHSPTAKLDDPRSGPAAGQVIGDHAFHSPAIVLQKDGLYVCLVPDLDMINAHAIPSPDARRTQRLESNRFSIPILDALTSMPTALDLNAGSGLTRQPVFSYGMMDFVVGHHVRYQRGNDPSMVRHLSTPRIRYGYDLLVGANQPSGSAFTLAVQHLWRRYGQPQFRQQPHLAMPFAEYVRTIYDVVRKPMPPAIQASVPGYEDNGVFLDFEMNGEPVGGMVAPLGSLGFGDALWNFEFWNNIRDARGMVAWGERLGIPGLKERGQRIVNLALQAPRNEAGFFPLVYHAAAKRWALSSLGPSPSPNSIFHRATPVHNVVAMSKSAAHLLEFYQDCGRDARIPAYLRPFAEGLLARIDGRGAIPSYYTTDMKPIADLHHSAQPAAMMWFLAEMAIATGEARYRQGAERIAAYLRAEILPQQRWVDLEVHYSCGRNPLHVTLDKTQGLPIRGNLSAIWAAKGFLALHAATGDRSHLETGALVADYLGFSQACWDPHYVYTANPFGGCTADNLDTANWLDARQCELVEPFIRYGLALGRVDLVERGVAAARASTVLVHHPRHIENNIYAHVNFYGFGLGPENINHHGHNQSTMRTHPSWGECSGIFTGLADAARLTAGGLLDLEHGFAVGTDGIHLSLERKSGEFHATAQARLSGLTRPWDQPYEIELLVRGRASRPLRLNGMPCPTGDGGEMQRLRCRIEPSGVVSLPGTGSP